MKCKGVWGAYGPPLIGIRSRLVWIQTHRKLAIPTFFGYLGTACARVGGCFCAPIDKAKGKKGGPGRAGGVATEGGEKGAAKGHGAGPRRAGGEGLPNEGGGDIA